MGFAINEPAACIFACAIHHLCDFGGEICAVAFGELPTAAINMMS
jgi:hypothetical protein